MKKQKKASFFYVKSTYLGSYLEHNKKSLC